MLCRHSWKRSGFYLDTSTGTAEPISARALYNKGFGTLKILADAGAVNKISIPLNLYSYFVAFKNNLHPKINVLLKLADDNDIIYRSNTASESKVTLTKFRLWCPKSIFNWAGMKLHVENYLKPKTYLREHQERIQTTSITNFFRISTGIRRPRHVFLWFVPTGSYNSQEHNIFTFKNFSIGAKNLAEHNQG